ncbi:YfhO family protein [Porphyromonas sp.]|uniref:YfhO family protein n=1 Tax=Porphyromonas sp. TaxID=1924944 RepID=UPI0026DBF554|nr:YfhO family protein [Porphyromonas sp.]MDO4695120.1 YfhO family protein [Porphyromonas sp.]MDO4770235.1 YfhO family protein [Porphyromonas sp.]
MNTLEQAPKKWWQHPISRTIAIIVVFALIALAYFYPAAFEGRKLFQMDGAGSAGVARDVVEVRQETGHSPLWTGNVFGGMPMYQISPTYPSSGVLNNVQKVYQLKAPFDLLPGDTYLVFLMLIGFYILMRSCRVRPLLSVPGAVMWAFSSYFLILIDAGHIWKLLTLSYIPPTIAGLVLAFHRRKYFLGFSVTALFTALQIYSNHIQMSYYFAILMLGMVIAWAIEAYRQKDWKHFGKSLGSIVLAGLVGVSVNVTNLYHTYKYSKETMRGGSELVTDSGAQKTSSTGLDKEYITQWSYGIDEMLTFLIPDAKGGFSSHIGMTEPALDEVQHPQSRQFVAQQNRYWGDQPFTAGPVYVGAFVLALAFFGFFASKGPMKWALGIVTVLTVMLSWGHNMMWLSDLFIDHVPLYNKFRTVSSILVVAEMTIPLFAVWGLYMIGKDPKILKEKKLATYASVALTGGVALLMLLMPSLSGGFLSDMERSAFASYTAQQPEFQVLVNDLESVRQAIFRADAVRSLVILFIGMGVIALLYFKRVNTQIAFLLITALTLIDLWSVDKRYLNDSKYLESQEVSRRAHTRTPIDDEILKDKSPHRVMNLTVSTFNDGTTSYLHRSVGGYHPAKLQRYQDVIEAYLSKNNVNVLRALNTKYYIAPDSTRTKAILITDDEVYGAAWFVRQVHKVKDAKEEFAAIGQLPLDQVAVIAPPFTDKVKGFNQAVDSLATVTQTSYVPDRITYKVSSQAEDNLVVFSEIYYPDGWYATIDGKEAEILRADYILRALRIPKGEHEVVFEFRPKSIKRTEMVAYIGTAILCLSFVGLVVLYFIRRKRK